MTEHEVKQVGKLILCILMPLLLVCECLISFLYNYVVYPGSGFTLTSSKILTNNFIYTLLTLLPLSFVFFWHFIKLYMNLTILSKIKYFTDTATASIGKNGLSDCDLSSDDSIYEKDDSANDETPMKSNRFYQSIDIQTLGSRKKPKKSLGLCDFKNILTGIFLNEKNAVEFYGQNVLFIYATSFFSGLGTITVNFF
jgi:hypothetical protein